MVYILLVLHASVGLTDYISFVISVRKMLTHFIYKTGGGHVKSYAYEKGGGGKSFSSIEGGGGGKKFPLFKMGGGGGHKTFTLGDAQFFSDPRFSLFVAPPPCN